MTYARDGYAVRPLFEAHEVAGLRGAVAAHMQQMAGALLKPLAETEPAAPFDERIERIAASDQSYAQLLGTAAATDAQRAPTVAKLANDRRLISLAAELTGYAIGDTIFRFRLNSSAMPKGRQAWHSDVARIDPDNPSQLVVTAWIPLTDAGADSGGLEIVPGRRDSPVSHDELGGKIVIDAQNRDLRRTITPEVPAGHCLFLDRFTPHRAVENRSGRTRWSLVVWMKRAEAQAA